MTTTTIKPMRPEEVFFLPSLKRTHRVPYTLEHHKALEERLIALATAVTLLRSLGGLYYRTDGSYYALTLNGIVLLFQEKELENYCTESTILVKMYDVTRKNVFQDTIVVTSCALPRVMAGDQPPYVLDTAIFDAENVYKGGGFALRHKYARTDYELDYIVKIVALLAMSFGYPCDIVHNVDEVSVPRLQ